MSVYGVSFLLNQSIKRSSYKVSSTKYVGERASNEFRDVGN